MKKGIFARLAFNNIRKNKNTFFPFLLAVITMVMLFFMLSTITYQIENAKIYGAEDLFQILGFGVFVTAALSMGIIFYTNSFLVKRRTKELGLYNILGMEKKHICHVLFWEIMIVSVAGFFAGMFFGGVFSRLMYLILLNMIGMKADITFHLQSEAIAMTTIVFGGVFMLALLYDFIRIFFLKPVDMLGAQKKGEKELRFKGLFALIGVASLGSGYYLAVTTENPMAVLQRFFLAVALVIVGTIFLFLAGSIVLLKLLKKNKAYYYHPTHFITTSDMMYRMKKNAVGLANICIFATAVVITLSTTVSLFVGIEDEVQNRFPSDITYNIPLASFNSKEKTKIENIVDETIEKEIAKNSFTQKNIEKSHSLTCTGTMKGNKCSFGKKISGVSNLSGVVEVEVRTCDEYNALYGTNYQVSEGKVIVSKGNCAKNAYQNLIFNLENGTKKELAVEKCVPNLSDKMNLGDFCDVLVILVPDYSAMENLQNTLRQVLEIASIQYDYSFNLGGKGKTFDQKKAFGNALQKKIEKNTKLSINLDSKYETYNGMVNLYSGLLFVGIFVGVLFMVATVLIIYYKQISEGYEDRKNFQILQKVGLGRQEVKKIINSQIKTVFFLPIGMMIIHVIFAFSIVKKLLGLLMLTNTMLFIQCTIGTIIVFILVYGVVYRLTSRTYYNIVNK